MYPRLFFKDGYCWIDNGLEQWKTVFKDYQIKGIEKRRDAWFRGVIEDNRQPDYVIISQIILRERNLRDS